MSPPLTSGGWEGLAKYAAGVGFPAAVAGYLLVRLESKLDGVTAALWALQAAVAALGATR